MNNLIIRPHGIGDIIMLIPALRGLVKNNPEEKFTLLVYKGSGQVLPSDLNINIIEMDEDEIFDKYKVSYNEFDNWGWNGNNF